MRGRSQNPSRQDGAGQHRGHVAASLGPLKRRHLAGTKPADPLVQLQGPRDVACPVAAWPLRVRCGQIVQQPRLQLPVLRAGQLHGGLVACDGRLDVLATVSPLVRHRRVA